MPNTEQQQEQEFRSAIDKYTRQVARFWQDSYLIYFTTFMRSLGSNVTAAFGWWVFSGAVDSDQGGAKADRDFTIFYWTLFGAFMLINFPNVFMEVWRKSFKFYRYFHTGALFEKTQFAPRSKWLKMYSGILNALSPIQIGFSLGTMLHNQDLPKPMPSPTDEPDVTMAFWESGWKALTEEHCQAIIYGGIGVIATSFLAAPQIISYFVKSKPMYGKNMTALTYAVYRVASSCFPIIRKILRDPEAYTPEQLSIKIVMVMLVTISRFAVYRRSNGIWYLLDKEKNSLFTPEQKEKLARINASIADAKERLKEAQGVRRKALKAHLSRLKSKKSDLDLEAQEAQETLLPCFSSEEISQIERKHTLLKTNAENRKISKQDRERHSQAGESFYHDLFYFLVSICGSAASAYLNYYSFLAIFSATGLLQKYPVVKSTISGLVAGSTFMTTGVKYLSTFMGNKNVPDEEFDRVINAQMAELDEQLSQDSSA